MNLKDQLIHDSMSECANRIKIIDQHAGQLAEAESLAEALRRVAPHLSGKASAYISGGIRTVIDIIIAVDEIETEAQPPAAMPLAA